MKVGHVYGWMDKWLNGYMDKLINTFQKLGKREKIGVIALILLSFAIGIGISFVISSPRNPSTPLGVTQQPISPTPLPKVAEVSLTADKKTITKGSKFDVDVILSTPKETEASDFVIQFDPKYLKAEKITEGIFFKILPIEKIATSSVAISGLATIEGNKLMIPKGTGKVATISFSAVSATTSTEIRFDPLNTVVAAGGENIIKTLTGINIKIN